MKKWFVIFSLLSVSVLLGGPSDTYYPHTLKSVKSGGKLLVLEDHSEWKVSSGKELSKNWAANDTIRVSPLLPPFKEDSIEKFNFKNLATDEKVTVKIETFPNKKKCVRVDKVKDNFLSLDNGETFDAGNFGKFFFMWEKGDHVILLDMDKENAIRGVMNYRNGKIFWLETRKRF